MEGQNNNSKVPWVIFYAVIGLLIIGIGWNITRIEVVAKQVDTYKIDVQVVQISQASMATDLIWIKTALLKIQDTLDKNR